MRDRFVDSSLAARQSVWPLVVFGCGLLLGCSSGVKYGDLKGKVTFKGKPVREGIVNLMNPTEGGSAEAKLDDEGNYEAKGIVVGDYVVTVSPLMVWKDTDPGKSPPAPVEKPAPDIPFKYRQQGSTPLRAKINEGPNQIDFDMKK